MTDQRSGGTQPSQNPAPSPEAMSFAGSDWALAANALTTARFIGAPLFAALIAVRNPWWLTFWFGLFLGLTDFFDGRFARRASPTRLGIFLDPLADKLAVLLPGYVLVGIGRFGWLPVTLIAIREVAVTIYRSYWVRRGRSIPARKPAKYKTLVQGLAIAAALCPPLESSPWVADTLLWFAVVFTVVTGYQYAVDGMRTSETAGSTV